ncbi:MAG: hypothetical protein EXR29_15080 [Betaproteobacteria bacterium]|nr:hypothetical protein [Betaproteobacteria bacterium]
MTQDRCDVQIKGGVVVNSRQLQLADVFIKDGIVDNIERPGSGKAALRVIDATGKFVLPGIVEAHLHPVYADRLDTLSKSAVYGGITTLIPYIGAVKAWGVEGNLWDAVNYFIDEGSKDSVIDFGLHCSLVSGDMAELENLVPKICARGVRSFKGFMAYRKRGMYLSDRDLLRILSTLKDNGGLFCVDAENGDPCDFLEEGFTAAGKTGPEFYAPSRPGITEAEAAFRILSFAKTLDCPMYIVHVRTQETLDVVDLFRQWGRRPSSWRPARTTSRSPTKRCSRWARSPRSARRCATRARWMRSGGRSSRARSTSAAPTRRGSC